MLSICLFWDIINVTYLGHYHNYFIKIRNNKIQNCQVNIKMSQILPNISTDFHGAFAFLNVYQKTVVSRDE